MEPKKSLMGIFPSECLRWLDEPLTFSPIELCSLEKAANFAALRELAPSVSPVLCQAAGFCIIHFTPSAVGESGTP